MKKIRMLLPLLALLMVSLCAKAEGITTPDPGKTYYIIHSSGYCMGESTGFITINAPSLTSNQFLKFIPVDGSAGVYNIKVGSTGTYIIKSGTWDVSLGADSTINAAKFTIEATTDGFVKFKCLDNSLYLGTDATADGSLVYSDKTGTDVKHQWVMMEVVNGQLVFYGLNAAIGSAETLLAGAVAGVNTGQYPQNVYDAFVTAIASAKNVKANATTQTAVNDALGALNAAISTFTAAKIKPVFIPVADKNYYIIHSSGNIITETSGAVRINLPVAANTQYFKFQAVADTTGIYNIQVVSTGAYITKSGSYNTTFATDPKVNVAKYKIEVVEGTTSTLRFKCLDNNKYLGTDAVASGSSVYSDKGGTDAKHYWVAKEVVDGELLKDMLVNAIAADQKLLDAAVVGTKAWEFPKESYDAFVLAIQTATNLVNTATLQTAINDGYTALSTAQTTFSASANKPMFLPQAGEKYRISTKKYSTKFINCNAGTVSGSQARIIAAPEQMWEFVRVNDTTYYIKNGTNSLSGTPALVAYDEATATKWTVKYNSTAGVIDYYGLQADGKCVSITSAGAVSMQTYVSTNTAHMAYFVKADLPDDPDKATLAAYIPTAEATLKSKTIGTTENTWPQAAFDAFKAVITSAKTMVDGNGNTQATVDAKLTELKAAETTYNNSKISTIIDNAALKAKIVSATSLVNSALVGEQIGQYLMSVIENFRSQVNASSALYSSLTKQSDIDAEVTALQTKMNAFTAASNTTVISVKTVMDDLNPIAQALYDNAQVGMDKGQFPASVKNKFQQDIDAAKAIQTPVRADLDAYLAAISAFKTSAVTVDRAVLKVTLANAKTLLDAAIPGSFNGQYSKSKMDELSVALSSANTIYNLSTATQLVIDSTNVAVGNKLNALKSSKVTIVFTAITSAINSANTLLSAAVVGETPGLYKQEVYDAFKLNVDHAVAINGSAQVNQTTVDSMSVLLASATTTFAKAYNPMIRTALKAIMDEAQLTYDNAVIGEFNGAYSTTTKQSLLNSINSAKTVFDKSDAVQVEIDNATALLTKVLSNFKLLAVKVNKVSLQTEITSMTVFADSVAKGVNGYSSASYTKFANALVAAKTTLNDPYAIQSDVDYALFALKAGKSGLVVTGLSTQTKSKIVMYSSLSKLMIQGMTEISNIQIYTMSGQLIQSVRCASATYSYDLPKGNYLVAIQSKDLNDSHVVYVK